MSRLCSSVVSRWISRGQLGVGLELQFLLGEVVIRLLELRLPVLPIMTNVDKKIASSDTISVASVTAWTR